MKKKIDEGKRKGVVDREMEEVDYRRRQARMYLNIL